MNLLTTDVLASHRANQFTDLRRKANWVRRTVLDMATRSQSGHVTTAFSLSELFVALYNGILRYNPQNVDWSGQDRFVLSEGQAGIGLYPVLADAGFFPVADLLEFTREGSKLGVHAEPGVPGIQVLTGSLGHGLPIITGMADAGKIDGSDHLVFCLTGDGELCEGSNWEALFTASTLQLNNVVIIVNRNHQFTIGFNDRRETQCDILLDPLPEKFAAFGCETRVIDGHSFENIFEAMADIRDWRKRDKPLCIIAETEKGHGGVMMAGQRNWHYRVPVDENLREIRKVLNEEALSLGMEVSQEEAKAEPKVGVLMQASKGPFIPGARDAYYDAWLPIFQRDKNMVLLSADDGGSPSVFEIAKLPGQFRNVGIAEEQMIGMACGLALEGRKVLTYAINPFIGIRAAEFVKLDACAMNLPITMIGIGAGFAYEIMGPTHHSVGLVSCLRCWPNLSIYSVADDICGSALAELHYESNGPQYVQFDRLKFDRLYEGKDVDFFRDGLGHLRKGKDGYIVAHGIMVHEALKIASELQNEKGWDLGVIDLFRLKPVNEELLLSYLADVPLVVTYEEEYLHGGMGSILAEVWADRGIKQSLLRIGQPDRFEKEMGGRLALWKRNGLDRETVKQKIVAKIESLR